MWTIECCTKQRDTLSSYQLGGTDGVRRQVIDEMKQAKLDRKEALKLAAKERGLTRREAYDRVLEERQGEE